MDAEKLARALYKRLRDWRTVAEILKAETKLPAEEILLIIGRLSA